MHCNDCRIIHDGEVLTTTLIPQCICSVFCTGIFHSKRLFLNRSFHSIPFCNAEPNPPNNSNRSLQRALVFEPFYSPAMPIIEKQPLPEDPMPADLPPLYETLNAVNAGYPSPKGLALSKDICGSILQHFIITIAIKSRSTIS